MARRQRTSLTSFCHIRLQLPAGVCSTFVSSCFPSSLTVQLTFSSLNRLAVVIAQAVPLTKFTLRWRLIGGVGLGAGSSILFSFFDDEKDFWPLIFPGLVIGSSALFTLFLVASRPTRPSYSSPGSLSVALAYVSAFVSLLMSVPPKYAGIAGGIWVST